MAKKKIKEENKANTSKALSPIDVIPALPIPIRRVSHPITEVLDRFLCATDDYRDALKVGMTNAAKTRVHELRRAAVKIEKFAAKNEDGADVLRAEGVHAARDMLEAMREIERLMGSRLLPLMARSFFIGLFSEMDSFMGAMLKCIYARKPQLYKAISREISLSDLFDFQDLNDVKRDMLEKEIDSFRRDSYIEQFSALEKKFEIKTLRNFPEWSNFVELTQRRNVMTHNDGRVSQQYLSICAREGVQFNAEPKIGDQLELPPDYLIDGIFVLSKVGFMLAHTLWRKVLPDELDKANESVNETLFKLLKNRRWRSVAAFGHFALTEPMSKGLQDLDRRIRVINTAIGLERLNKKGEAHALVETVDWSASIREFKLAIAVIRGEFAEAAAMMRDIGKKGEIIEELSYHDWPLFDEFRGRLEFQQAYEAIYGVPFLDKVSKDARSLSQNLKNLDELKSEDAGMLESKRTVGNKRTVVRKKKSDQK